MNLPGARVGPVNLGSTAEITIAELAELIVQLTNSRSRLVYQEALPDDPRRRKPDTSHAHQLFKWSASTSLEAGLRKTIAWFDAQLSSAVPEPRRIPVLEAAVG
jgi:UDP-glucuronate decarboxylase